MTNLVPPDGGVHRFYAGRDLNPFEKCALGRAPPPLADEARIEESMDITVGEIKDVAERLCRERINCRHAKEEARSPRPRTRTGAELGARDRR